MPYAILAFAFFSYRLSVILTRRNGLAVYFTSEVILIKYTITYSFGATLKKASRRVK